MSLNEMKYGVYKWSSAKFYKSGVDEFAILTDYRKRF
jgi:hypothetical protein